MPVFSKRNTPVTGILLISLAATLAVTTAVRGQTVNIRLSADTPPVRFGAEDLRQELLNVGVKVTINDDEASSKSTTIYVNDHANVKDIAKEGFRIMAVAGDIRIISNDATGAMYGLMDLAEVVSVKRSMKDIGNKTVNPHFTVRAIKFNLPWSSYRTGEVMTQHQAVCKDLKFWESFLDQMARNRFNVLSLWNVHPFSFMVKPNNFPLANNFSEKEMAEWKTFWSSLFRMAKDRGIETYIVNWNIAVSPEFANAYHVLERNDTSSLVKKYTKEVVTQVINEYPDLSGLGVTLADWMSNFPGAGSKLPTMTASTREDWISDTFVEGMKAADHPVKFIHRSVLSSDPAEMRRIIDYAALKDTTLVEIKFNWSHGHSTPALAITHDSHSGKIDKGYWDPLPANYRIEWMIRNEDFFILRWGQPDFIREHIATNSDRYVNGYFVGSEGYIPAKDYSHIASPHQTWKYAFEKQWLFYMLWGRLLYDPKTPDLVFEKAFEKRYEHVNGKTMLNTSSQVSNMPLRLAAFYAGTWDYTLYSEGFLSPFAVHPENDDKASSFISINELINQPALDPDYLSIKSFVDISINKKSADGKLLPLALADSLDKDGHRALKTIRTLRKSQDQTLQCELDDLETWAYLSLYFSEKLKAGVNLQWYRTTRQPEKQKEAITQLQQCHKYWIRISSITKGHYREVPYLDDDSSKRLTNADAHVFSWAKFLAQVERDIDLARQ